ncbi:MAG: hypothetical protein IPJ65_14085 [Archangiaceae bacterium]|nr:hypothetical protein [Archangiaceae bacterium]
MTRISRRAVGSAPRPQHEPPRRRSEAKAPPLLEAPRLDTAAALEGVAAPPSTSDRAERLSELWRYARSHAPGSSSCPVCPGRRRCRASACWW